MSYFFANYLVTSKSFENLFQVGLLFPIFYSFEIKLITKYNIILFNKLLFLFVFYYQKRQIIILNYFKECKTKFIRQYLKKYY